MAKKSQDKNHCFLLSWDCYGLESCVPVHELEKKYHQAEKERVWTTLASESAEDPGNPVDREVGRIYNTMLLRARMNSQRHYEIYTVQTSSDINKNDMVRMFEENPQHMAELIRERGTKLYSDRASQKTVIV